MNRLSFLAGVIIGIALAYMLQPRQSQPDDTEPKSLDARIYDSGIKKIA